MTPVFDSDAQEFIQKRMAGGLSLEVGVTDSVYMGGLREDAKHPPLVYVGRADWESDDELSFFANRVSLEAFIERLRAAGDSAWGLDK